MLPSGSVCPKPVERSRRKRVDAAGRADIRSAAAIVGRVERLRVVGTELRERQPAIRIAGSPALADAAQR